MSVCLSWLVGLSFFCIKIKILRASPEKNMEISLFSSIWYRACICDASHWWCGFGICFDVPEMLVIEQIEMAIDDDNGDWGEATFQSHSYCRVDTEFRVFFFIPHFFSSGLSFRDRNSIFSMCLYTFDAWIKTVCVRVHVFCLGSFLAFDPFRLVRLNFRIVCLCVCVWVSF